MTQQKPQIENGTVIKRPSMFNNMDGILNGMKWDANGKSALFFFSVGRTSGEGDKRVTRYTNFSARFRGRNAHFLESVLNHKKATKDRGEKFIALINMNGLVSSYERDTGRTWGDDNKPVTETVAYFEAKDPMLMNPSDYSVVAQGRFHVLPEEEQQQQQA